MDAFRNYNNLISGINADNQMRDSAVRAVADAKQKSDGMGKTLGEVKSFLSGQHGGRAFAKDIKPYLKQRAERLAEKAKAEINSRIKSKVEQVANRVKQARTEAEQRLAQGRQAVQNRLNGTPEANENTGTENATQSEPAGENVNNEYDDWDTPQGEDTNGGEAQDGYDDWDTPFTGEEAGEGDADLQARGFDSWETKWGEDTIEESRAGTFSNPIANSRANLQNPSVQDSQNPMVDRSEPPSYEEALDDAPTKDVNFADRNEQDLQYADDDGNAIPAPKYEPNPNEPTGGSGDGALSNESQMSNVAPKASGAGSSTEAGTQDEIDKGLADQMAKQSVKTGVDAGVEEGAAEGGLSVLDAIPGLDILGFVGGGILAAVEAHKQKKEEGIEDAGAQGLANQAVQIGLE